MVLLFLTIYEFLKTKLILSVVCYGLAIPSLIAGHKMEKLVCGNGTLMVTKGSFRSLKKREVSSGSSNQQVLFSLPVIQSSENPFIFSVCQLTQLNNILIVLIVYVPLLCLIITLIL